MDTRPNVGDVRVREVTDAHRGMAVSLIDPSVEDIVRVVWCCKARDGELKDRLLVLTRYRMTLVRYTSRLVKGKGKTGTIVPYAGVVRLSGELRHGQFVVAFSGGCVGRWDLRFESQAMAIAVAKDVFDGVFRGRLGWSLDACPKLVFSSSTAKYFAERRQRLALAYDGIAYAYPAFAVGYGKGWGVGTVETTQHILYRYPMTGSDGVPIVPMAVDVQFSLGRLGSLNGAPLEAGMPLVKALAQNRWFRALRLRSNSTYKHALRVFAPILKYNTTLQAVELASPPSPSRSKMILLGRSLALNPGSNITTFTIVSASIAGAGGVLAEGLFGLPHLRSLTLKDVSLTDSDMAEIFEPAAELAGSAGFSRLRYLNLAGNGKIVGSGSRALRTWLTSPATSRLATLVLDGTLVGLDNLFAGLCTRNAVPLAMLDVSSWVLEKKGSPSAVALLYTQSSTVTGLNWSHTKSLSRKGVAAAFLDALGSAELPSGPRPLRLGMAGLQPKAWAPIVSVIPGLSGRLRSLVLDDARIGASEFSGLVAALGQLDGLASLSLCRVFHKGRFKKKDVLAQALTELALMVSESSVTALFLNGGPKAQIGPVGAEALLLNTRSLQSLVTLHLADNGIGDHGMELVVRLVHASRVLSTLEIDGSCVTMAGLESLCVAIASSPSVVSCEIPRNDLDAMRESSSSRRVQMCEEVLRNATRANRHAVYHVDSDDEPDTDSDASDGDVLVSRDTLESDLPDGSAFIFHEGMAGEMTLYDRTVSRDAPLASQLSMLSLEELTQQADAARSLEDLVPQRPAPALSTDSISVAARKEATATARMRESMVLGLHTKEAAMYRLVGDGRRPMDCTTLAALQAAASPLERSPTSSVALTRLDQGSELAFVQLSESALLAQSRSAAGGGGGGGDHQPKARVSRTAPLPEPERRGSAKRHYIVEGMIGGSIESVSSTSDGSLKDSSYDADAASDLLGGEAHCLSSEDGSMTPLAPPSVTPLSPPSAGSAIVVVPQAPSVSSSSSSSAYASSSSAASPSSSSSSSSSSDADDESQSASAAAPGSRDHKVVSLVSLGFDRGTSTTAVDARPDATLGELVDLMMEQQDAAAAAAAAPSPAAPSPAAPSPAAPSPALSLYQNMDWSSSDSETSSSSSSPTSASPTPAPTPAPAPASTSDSSDDEPRKPSAAPPPGGATSKDPKARVRAPRQRLSLNGVFDDLGVPAEPGGPTSNPHEAAGGGEPGDGETAAALLAQLADI